MNSWGPMFEPVVVKPRNGKKVRLLTGNDPDFRYSNHTKDDVPFEVPKKSDRGQDARMVAQRERNYHERYYAAHRPEPKRNGHAGQSKYLRKR